MSYYNKGAGYGYASSKGGKGGRAFYESEDAYGGSYLSEAPSAADRLPATAQKLSDMREGLTEDAMRSYRALQVALQRYSTPNASQQDFERDFNESLAAMFPGAYSITATQIGNNSQWEVRINNGDPMYCSVRLEVLTDDVAFTRELKAKSKIVKEVLLTEGGHWKKMLSQRGGVNREKLQQFEQECRMRSNMESAGGRGGRGGGDGDRDRGTKWQDQKQICNVCGRGTDEDQLSGTHMCVVNATFQCLECGNTWSSFHGRRRPDGELMGQKCSRCKGQGQEKDWRIVTQAERDEVRDRFRDQMGGKMHHSELCDACRTFGNCMGVFHDPFVITMALTLCTSQHVQWASFSHDMPELLIANMDNKQVCLQPHVYLASPDEFKGGKKGGKGKGKRPAEKEIGPREQVPREQGGVKDQGLLGSFLGSDGGKGKGKKDRDDANVRGEVSGGSAGYGSGRPDFQPARQPPNLYSSSSSFMQSQDYLPYGSEASEHAIGGGLGGDGSAPAAEGYQRWYTSEASEGAPSEPTVTTKLSRNKIAVGSSLEVTNTISQSAASNAVATPLLTSLGRIRKAQFLHHVAKYLKSQNRPDSDKFTLAEEILMKSNGSYETAYHNLKALIPVQHEVSS